ncbi:arylamine N-acetyltransferase family protein [Aurantiacibacter rhizosphaerae]|uniref:Arylamine N-acetyltransferase n=1 Tax=Aurantiacibacter rhizosphaerae TaxID=2691582 RepID=A0A844X8C7_9SPHN|nr:arylamine N-acetyltransferase [Aurantiacibacter rhizosphaerae]MWV26631.1 arylamine N-acetyltransferase [Aurantiacibacter rhizosphaerae]
MHTTNRLSPYLKRIGLQAPVQVDPTGLARIQSAHRQSIPFENFDIPLGRGVTCDSDAVFAKLVEARRGGFCFEHNRLLADMLTDAGFTNRILLARVLLGDPPAPTARAHCLLLVEFGDERWICDAGFGGSYAPPMRLRDGERAQTGDGAHHRLSRIGQDGDLPGAWLLERMGPKLATDGRVNSDDQWEKQYAFDLMPVAQADLALGCHWSATHEGSRFTNLTVASICLPDGFASLVDRQLTVWRKSAPMDRRSLDTPQAYGDALASVFGISLNTADIARLPLF